jgi:uncharacterized protein (DUF934 family)
MPIVTDTGFLGEADTIPLISLAAIEAGGGDPASGLEITNDTAVTAILPYLAVVPLVAVVFPNFADGRGFSLAKRLRAAGFTGRLRAKGHVIADQYAMARACGFDEVEIDACLAERQPESHWLAARFEGGQALSARRLPAAAE